MHRRAVLGIIGLAMQWIGDDVRQATKYIKERASEFQELADAVNA